MARRTAGYGERRWRLSWGENKIKTIINGGSGIGLVLSAIASIDPATAIT